MEMLLSNEVILKLLKQMVKVTYLLFPYKLTTAKAIPTSSYFFCRGDNAAITLDPQIAVETN
jgi:hypothetical protein